MDRRPVANPESRGACRFSLPESCNSPFYLLLSKIRRWRNLSLEESWR